MCHQMEHGTGRDAARGSFVVGGGKSCARRFLSSRRVGVAALSVSGLGFCLCFVSAIIRRVRAGSTNHDNTH